MTRPNGLDVPAAACVLIAALPFEVSVWPSIQIGRSEEFLLIAGPAEWAARAGSRFRDPVAGTAYSVPTLRGAVFDALAGRVEACERASCECYADAKRRRGPDNKKNSQERGKQHQDEADLVRETIAALKAAWPEVTP